MCAALSSARARDGECSGEPAVDSSKSRVYHLFIWSESGYISGNVPQGVASFSKAKRASSRRLSRARQAAADEDEAALALCEAIERELRKGSAVYVYSRLGHGRAGMIAAVLLGRLYGLAAADALERVSREKGVHDV